jgi:predicted ATPase
MFQDYNIDYLKNNTYISYKAKDKSYFMEFQGVTNITNSVTLDSNSSSQYIPAERNLISIFNKYVTTFITADIPLPKFLLNFSSQYVRAREEIRALDFLNVKYKFQNDQERIFYNDKDFLLLEQSSSGIQSALPLYLTVKYFAQKHKSIIIEEPEQNLFPKAQKETIEYIVEQISDKNNLFMMTHSPYVLTALNNLILANDVKTQKGVEAIDGIVKQEQCVAFEEVSAYSLIDGKSINIMDKEDRLIGVNLIDSISDEVSDTFDKLLAKLD